MHNNPNLSIPIFSHFSSIICPCLEKGGFPPTDFKWAVVGQGSSRFSTPQCPPPTLKNAKVNNNQMIVCTNVLNFSIEFFLILKKCIYILYTYNSLKIDQKEININLLFHHNSTMGIFTFKKCTKQRPIRA